MIRVAILSPLGASTRELIEVNKEYGRRCMWDSLKRGEAPFASHILFDQPGLLDDLDPSERNMGIQAGLAWEVMAHVAAVYMDKGVSRGMQYSMDFLRHKSIPIEHRWLDIEKVSQR